MISIEVQLALSLKATTKRRCAGRNLSAGRPLAARYMHPQPLDWIRNVFFLRQRKQKKAVRSHRARPRPSHWQIEVPLRLASPPSCSTRPTPLLSTVASRAPLAGAAHPPVETNMSSAVGLCSSASVPTPTGCSTAGWAFPASPPAIVNPVNWSSLSLVQHHRLACGSSGHPALKRSCSNKTNRWFQQNK